MQAWLRDLGFTEIEIVDEDLGRSASGTVLRSGFERLVPEVSLGRVGAVAVRGWRYWGGGDQSASRASGLGRDVVRFNLMVEGASSCARKD